MKAIEYAAGEGGFTLSVREPGWNSQRAPILMAAVCIGIAGLITHSIFTGPFAINGRPARPVDSLYFSPLWLAGIWLLGTAFQGAYRRVVFAADDAELVIAMRGPLRQSERKFSRAAFQAAKVADSNTRVNGRRLMQLALYFDGREKPLKLMTGRDEAQLAEIARLLTEGLSLPGNAASERAEMEVQEAPIHSHIFKIICGIGVGIGLILLALRGVIGLLPVVFAFFVTVVTAIVVIAMILRRASCPRCGQTIRRDGQSGEGYFQYKCSACRVVWQSQIRAGGPH
ncbi:MAG TPA: hypothetical protein VHM90_03680 [Phycisphaerae bacterium]|nr:hypothetical protein [Phycisphaerae bacterium]